MKVLRTALKWSW